MDKREVKKLACFHASMLIEDQLSNGWETLDRYGKDRERVEAALNELRAELDRRSLSTPSTNSAA